MWSATFSSLLHPCVVTDVMLVVGVDMLSDVKILVMDAPVIALRFVIGVSYAGVLAAFMFDVVFAIDVDMLADENANGLAAATTP